MIKQFGRRWISKWAQSDAVATNKKADHVDDKFELIYRPPSASMLMVATSFCSISAFSCPLMLGQFAYDKFFDHNTELIEQIPTEQIVTMGVIGAASMVALTFCRTMPLRIYKHEKEFVSHVIAVHLIWFITFAIRLQVHCNFAQFNSGTKTKDGV